MSRATSGNRGSSHEGSELLQDSHDVKFTLGPRLLAAKHVLEKGSSMNQVAAVSVTALVYLELCSLFMIVFAAWVTNAYWLLPLVIVVQWAFAAHRAGSITAPWDDPLTLWFPYRYSHIGLDQRQDRDATGWYCYTIGRNTCLFWIAVLSIVFTKQVDAPWGSIKSWGFWEELGLEHGCDMLGTWGTYYSPPRCELGDGFRHVGMTVYDSRHEALQDADVVKQSYGLLEWAIIGVAQNNYGNWSLTPHPSFYAACVRELPWVTRGTCNSLLGLSMVVGSRGSSWVGTGSLILSLLTLVLMIATTIFWLFLPCMCCAHGGRLGRTTKDEYSLECIAKKEQEIRETIASQARGDADQEQTSEAYVTPWDVAKKVGLFIFDYASDMTTTVNFYRLKHKVFAFIMSAVFARSFCMSWRHGGILGVISEARKSCRYGMYTDRLIGLIDVEQGVEAVPAMLMQFYAFPWTAHDPFSNFTFVVSVALSFASTSQVIYNRFHLGLCVQDLMEE